MTRISAFSDDDLENSNNNGSNNKSRNNSQDSTKESETVLEPDPTLSVEDSERLKKMDFKNLIPHPNPGSYLRRLTSIKNNKDIEHVLTKVVLRDLFGVFMSPMKYTYCYVVFRLVHPHSVALQLANEVESIQKSDPSLEKLTEFELLSLVTGKEMKDRSSIMDILKEAGSYHPEVMQKILNFIQSEFK